MGNIIRLNRSNIKNDQLNVRLTGVGLNRTSTIRETPKISDHRPAPFNILLQLKWESGVIMSRSFFPWIRREHA